MAVIREATQTGTGAAPNSIPGRERVRLAGQLLGLALLLAVLIFLQSLRFGFVYDDRSAILQNPNLSAWQGLHSYFGGNVWAQNSGLANNYFRPIYSIWMRLVYSLFGPRAWGWHLANLLLYLGEISLLFFAAAELTGDRLTAGVASLLFAVHPTHAEVVSWSSGGPSDLLCGLGVLAAFSGFLKWRSAVTTLSSCLWLALSVFGYYFALFSKEVAIGFPLVVIAHEWIARGPAEAFGIRARRAALAIMPFVPVTGLYLALRHHALRGLVQTTVNIPHAAQYLTLPLLVLFYLRLSLYPAALGPYYDLPYVLKPDLRLFWLPLLCVLLLAVVFAVAFRWVQRHDSALRDSRAFLVSAIWAGVFLAPALLIADLLPYDFAHGRYLYVPSMGLCIMTAIALTAATGTGHPAVFGMGRVRATILMAGCVALALVSVRQSAFWANNILLFTRGATIAPGNMEGLSNLASSLCESHLYDQCIAIQKQILAGRPGYALAYFNLVTAYMDAGNEAEAERMLLEAERSGSLDLYQFVRLAYVEMDLRHFDEAGKTIEQIKALAPNYPGLSKLKGELAKRTTQTAQPQQPAEDRRNHK